MKSISTGINGFGRFGLHLLKYWLDRSNESNFTIDYINDDFLNQEEIYKTILNDQYVIFNKYKVQLSSDNHLNIIKPSGERFSIMLTSSNPENMDWLGEPDLFLECSGKRTVAESNGCLLVRNTKLVLVSATSWDIPKTLVYGFNHEDLDLTDKLVSYGSCTVNAYVPLAKYMQDEFGYVPAQFVLPLPHRENRRVMPFRLGNSGLLHLIGLAAVRRQVKHAPNY